VTGIYPRAALFLQNLAPSLLHTKDKFGAMPLHYCGSAAVTEGLLALKADINALDDAGQTALYNAVLKGLGPVVRQLCNLGAETNTGAGRYCNPLHAAVLNTHHELATMLIGFGASTNLQDKDGNTALHLAARKSPGHILRLLLDNGADACILNNRGHTALHTAVESRNVVAIEELSLHDRKLIHITRPKDLERVGIDESTRSPLFLCAQMNYSAAIERMVPLLDQSVIEATGWNDRSILHHAADLGSLDLVSNLVRRGANVDVQDARGNTPLMLAVRHRTRERTSSLKICQELIKHGAITTLENENGEMAWDIAVNDIQDNTYGILALLLHHSAEACRNVTRQKKETVQSGIPTILVSSYDLGSSSEDLVEASLHQTDSRLSTASNVEPDADATTFVLSRRDREPCGKELVYKAIHRPDQRLLAALKTRMILSEFSAAEAQGLADTLVLDRYGVLVRKAVHDARPVSPLRKGERHVLPCRWVAAEASISTEPSPTLLPPSTTTTTIYSADLNLQEHRRER
jgi:ankyrin repeat protein